MSGSFAKSPVRVRPARGLKPCPTFYHTPLRLTPRARYRRPTRSRPQIVQLAREVKRIGSFLGR